MKLTELSEERTTYRATDFDHMMEVAKNHPGRALTLVDGDGYQYISIIYSRLLDLMFYATRYKDPDMIQFVTNHGISTWYQPEPITAQSLINAKHFHQEYRDHIKANRKNSRLMLQDPASMEPVIAAAEQVRSLYEKAMATGKEIINTRQLWDIVTTMPADHTLFLFKNRPTVTDKLYVTGSGVWMWREADRILKARPSGDEYIVVSKNQYVMTFGEAPVSLQRHPFIERFYLNPFTSYFTTNDPKSFITKTYL